MYNKSQLKNIRDAQKLIQTTLTWTTKIKVASANGVNGYLFKEMNKIETGLINKNLNTYEKIEFIEVKLSQINKQVRNNKVERLIKSGYDYNEALFNLEESAKEILNLLKN